MLVGFALLGAALLGAAAGAGAGLATGGGCLAANSVLAFSINGCSTVIDVGLNKNSVKINSNPCLN